MYCGSLNIDNCLRTEADNKHYLVLLKFIADRLLNCDQWERFI